MKIALLVAGPKGLNLLERFPRRFEVTQVVSYASRGLQLDTRASIREICRSRDYPYADRRDVPGLPANANVILLAGWQHLENLANRHAIVFHDSLLPQLRGFNPTVTAMISGATQLGVTAFAPQADIDTGPIYGQEAIAIAYPLTIRKAYEYLGIAYAALAERLLDQLRYGPLPFREQDPSTATYSLWRDEDDYWIDWSETASRIRRFVDAVGWPYLGAKTTLGGRVVRIVRAEEATDLTFPLRQHGKLWPSSGGNPLVICGSGMLSILEAHNEDGKPVTFNSLRLRLGK